jgi:uncharacterized protein
MSICAGAADWVRRESDMTPEERQMLTGLFERVSATGSTPRDAAAESFINDAVRAVPYSPYVLAQTVLVQQHALEAAANRVAELEAAAREGAEQPQEQGSFLGNLGKSIFGGSAPAAAPPRPSYDPSAAQRGPGPAPGQNNPPPPQGGYAPASAPGPWGAPAGGAPAGGGFLQNALSTATGVAGGVAIGNLLGGLFGGHSAGGGIFGAGSPGGGATGGTETINNYYEAPEGHDRGADNVQDANFDGVDDSAFDSGSDDGGGGGGYDDV